MARDTLAYSIGNAASTTLASSVSNSATSMVLTSDTNFAAKSGEGMILVDEGESTEEIAYSTTKSGATLTTPLANRGLEGGSAQAHSAAATVKGILTAAMWNDLIDSLANVLLKTTGALDTSKVVDLTTAQTLTNKKLSDSTTSIVNVTTATKAVKFSVGGATTAKTSTLTFVHTDDRAITFPDATDTLVGKATTDTLTSKRITKRTGTTTSSATPTINTDNVDFYSLTAQAADITSFTTNLSGTPTEAQTLWIAITGTAARAITWGTSFEASTTALPTTTVTTARLDVGFVWNTVTSKWRCVASV